MHRDKDTKICRDCNIEKDISKFNKNSNRPGKVSRCKPCHAAQMRQWRKENNALSRLTVAKAALRFKYSLSEEDIQAIIDRKICCQICGHNPENDAKRINVDHDHVSGKVRGFLCRQCNQGLGNFKDNTDLMRNAIKYLENANANK